MALLQEQGKEVTEFQGIMSNPTYAKVQEGAKLCRDHKIDFILAVGGGSVSDCCKAVSAQAKLTSDLYDYEYQEKKIPQDGIPMGVIVTAAGTGSEQNAGAVITYEEKTGKGLSGVRQHRLPCWIRTTQRPCRRNRSSRVRSIRFPTAWRRILARRASRISPTA